MARLLCNTCGEYFTAQLPDDVIEDGKPNQKYSYSARSLMALHKFFAGATDYRQESTQVLMGIKLVASTIFDQTELVANSLQPIYNLLRVFAANAEYYYLDDTNNRILDKVPIEKPQRNRKNSGAQWRYSSVFYLSVSFKSVLF